MNILQKIVEHKAAEVAKRKELSSVMKLMESPFYKRSVVSLKDHLNQDHVTGIIAEIKRSAPSAGDLALDANVEELSKGYIQAGATALSVLTDKKYFNGEAADLIQARSYNACPILRKDFIIDSYQVHETKSIGADCMLLIANALSAERCLELAKLAKDIGLEVLLEVHDECEIESHLSEYIDIVGVNNRQLTTFTTHIEQSFRLADHIPSDLTKISESGITNAAQIKLLKEYGYRGFLIGTHFMKHQSPADECKHMVSELIQE